MTNKPSVSASHVIHIKPIFLHSNLSPLLLFLVVHKSYDLEHTLLRPLSILVLFL